MRDARLALRSLLRSPSFSIAAVVALALGIGANTAVFSVVNGVLLRPLPYGGADRVVRVFNQWDGAPRANLSTGEYFDYADGTTEVFEAFGVWAYDAANLSGEGDVERVRVAGVTAGVLPALDVRMREGRTFTAAEDLPGGAPIAIVTEGLVARRLGGEPAAGRGLVLDGQSYTIVGVLPSSFRLPDSFGDPVPPEVFLPLRPDRAGATRGSHFLRGVGRLRAGVTREYAGRRLQQIASDFVQRLPADYPRDMGFSVSAVDLRHTIVGDIRPLLLLLLGAVGLVLLVTCSNVASLLLARLDGRRREFALRVALGASRASVARTVFTETGVLAVVAGVLGVVIAAWGTAGLISLMPAGLAASIHAPIDGRVMAFAALATLLALALASIAPIVRLDRGRAGLQAALRDGARGSGDGARQRLRRILITVEVALAVVLLAGSGLLLRSFIALLDVDPGYEVENVLTTRITLSGSAYATDAERRDFFGALQERLSASPGIEAAGAVTNLPLATSLGDLNFRFEGRPLAEGQVSPRLDWQVVTPGYFQAIGMRIVRGRGIEATDDERAPGVVVINETAAALHFRDVDPIGQRILLGGGAGPGWVTITGIVADVRHASLAAAPAGEMYLAHRQFTFWNGGSSPASMHVVVRTAVPPATLAPTVREVIRTLDPQVPAGAFATMRDIEAHSLAESRFMTVLIGTFAALALLLAALGLYGLIAWTVAERAQEIGVRMALGARAGQVVVMVARQGMLIVGAGLALGLLLALIATRALAGLLYGVQPADPATLLLITAVLLLVGAAACTIPARRAASVPPLHVLR